MKTELTGGNEYAHYTSFLCFYLTIANRKNLNSTGKL